MRAFSGILTGDLTGASAPDPSSSPYNISMSSSAESTPDAGTPDQPESDTSLDFEEEVEEEDDDDLEDTSPPVKVGEPQALSEIRRKIKKLMTSK
jgi:hypothetical protein